MMEYNYPEKNQPLPPTDLPKGRIRYLYVWVHPDWAAESFDSDKLRCELNVGREFIDRMVYAPRAALIQTPWSSRYFEGSHEKICESDVELLDSFNCYAKRQLGDRYHIWTDNQIRAPGSSPRNHHRELVALLNLEKSTHQDVLNYREQRRKRHLAKIYVYGKAPESCAAHQATQNRLDLLAVEVFHHPFASPQFWPHSYEGEELTERMLRGMETYEVMR